MEVQAALRLGHRARVRRVHAVPRRPRLHRALDRAHAPLARPLPRLARVNMDLRVRSCTGSSRAGSRRTCGARRRRRSPRATCFGIAIGGSLGEDKAQMFEVVEWTIEELPEDKPRHLLGIGEVDDLVRGVELGIDTFDCAMPTRIGRHGMALVPDPAQALARRSGQGALEGVRRAAARRLPVPGLRARATPARTCTTCSRPRSRPRCACSRSTTSPTCSA